MFSVRTIFFNSVIVNIYAIATAKSSDSTVINNCARIAVNRIGNNCRTCCYSTYRANAYTHSTAIILQVVFAVSQSCNSTGSFSSRIINFYISIITDIVIGNAACNAYASLITSCNCTTNSDVQNIVRRSSLSS